MYHRFSFTTENSRGNSVLYYKFESQQKTQRELFLDRISASQSKALVLLKTDSVQSSSNTCKNYLLKIYSQHEKFNVKLRKNAKGQCYCVYN